MATQSRLIFVNLPVGDLSASTAFFRALGFDFDDWFTDESCVCMVVSEHAYVMLLVECASRRHDEADRRCPGEHRGDPLRLGRKPRRR